MTQPAISEATLARLLLAARRLHCDPGFILFVLGDRNNEMYYIVSGAVELYFELGKLPKRMEAGQFFGELALIVGAHNRTATAVIPVETELLVLDQEGLRELSASAPESLFELARSACGYLVESERRLIQDLRQSRRELEFFSDNLGPIGQIFACHERFGLVDRDTGLFSKRCLLAYLGRLNDSHAPELHRMIILTIGLEGLKIVEERFGGDFLQRSIGWFAGLLRELLGPEDIAFQIAPEEFGVILLNPENRAADLFEQTLRSKLERCPLRLPGQTILLTPRVKRQRIEQGNLPSFD